MRVLLINPPLRRLIGESSSYYPMGLAYLAGIVRDMGHQVCVYDIEHGDSLSEGLYYGTEHQLWQNYINIINNEMYPLWEEISECIRNFEPDLVGIRAQTLTYASAMKIARLVKEYSQRCLVVMGGPHPSIKYEEVLEDENVDLVIREEGESSFSELIRAISSGAIISEPLPGFLTR